MRTKLRQCLRKRRGEPPKRERVHLGKPYGSVLVLVLVALIILTALGVGLLTVGYGVKRQAVVTKNEAVAMLAAEAGYEKAVFWMSQQKDMLSALQKNLPGAIGTIDFPDSYCDYKIEFFTFVGACPIYRIISNGYSGRYNKTVDAFVRQATSGWDMGICRFPSGATTTAAAEFVDREVIDVPLHINKLNDSPDKRDIYIQGSPQFLQPVVMSESRYTNKGFDKYAGVTGLFDGGIYFSQPNNRITDEASVQSKIDRFKKTTKQQFRFKPGATAPVSNPNPAVQLEFFVEGGVGKVRITNNCTVRGYRRSSDGQTWDFKIRPGSGNRRYQRYDIYAYHLKSTNNSQRFTRRIDQTYVRQSLGSAKSERGGQIFVDGNVIIGGDKGAHNGDQLVKGKITVVATENIWVADSILVDGPRDNDGKPSNNNPNVLGLIAQGVIKVVDPGMSDYSYVDDTPLEPQGFEYVPIGRQESGQPIHVRYLPDPTVIEAAITVAGGGWGAENVIRRQGSQYYGGRKQANGNQDQLIVRGAITEAVQGVIGSTGTDGYTKRYYFDQRMHEGLLPGDMWLRAKYIPAPAGWHDY